MKWWPSLFVKRAKNIFAVIEIGSTSVSGAFFKVREGEKTYHILSTAHAEICAREDDIEAFLDGVSRALLSVIDDLEKRQGEMPDHYFCILSSPFYINHIEHFSREEDSPFVVEEKMIIKLADEQAFKVKETEPILYGQLSPDQNLIIESKVMQIRLNDYEIKNPFGKRASKISFSQFVSIGSAKVIGSLRKIINNRTRLEPEFHSFTYCEYATLRDVYHFNENFLVVDVGGGITDLTAVSAGQIVDSLSFPMGQHFLVRWLSEAWPTTEIEIRSMLKLYLDNKLEVQTRNKIDALLEKIRQDWIKEFRLALARAAERRIVPAKIFIIGNSEETKIFMHWIAAEDLSQYTLVTKAVEVDFVDQRAFTPFYTGDTTRLRDTFLLVDAIFCGRIFREKHLRQ